MDTPEDHDYDAAQDYLSLVMDASTAASLAKSLRSAIKKTYKAKDLLRASSLRLLPEDNKHVKSDLAKVSSGKELSPVLMIRGNIGQSPLIIADGYHRVCASYYLDENTEIPCFIVPLQV
jgi:hypothetical protein